MNASALPGLMTREIQLEAPSRWAESLVNRNGFQQAFVRLLQSSPQLRGRVLDIGCGSGLPPALHALSGQVTRLDGVDPDPAVLGHPLLQERWNTTLERASVPTEAYDLAYAYNVLEHLADPAPFFRSVFDLLKPGGVFWALTPHGYHPFAMLSRGIELAGFKPYARRKIGRTESGEMAVNDYPAYYRANTPRAVRKAVRNLPFRSATFYRYPCVQWDTYFPRVLRWAPHLYDFLVGTRWPCLMQIFILRLEKPGLLPSDPRPGSLEPRGSTP